MTSSHLFSKNSWSSKHLLCPYKVFFTSGGNFVIRSAASTCKIIAVGLVTTRLTYGLIRARMYSQPSQVKIGAKPSFCPSIRSNSVDYSESRVFIELKSRKLLKFYPCLII